jgi:plasmid stability protein
MQGAQEAHMATLQVRNVPDDLYRRLQELASEERRSLGAEVIVLLESAVRAGQAAREPVADILARLKARRNAIKLPRNWPGSLELLREDRAR